MNLRLSHGLLAVLTLAAAFTVVSAQAPGETAYNVTRMPPHANLQGIGSYGRWCGGGHGGFQDCCNGGPCSACDYHEGVVSEKCLEQCPPIDELDRQCSQHDLCCFENPDGISCKPEGNRCACDCQLVRGAKAAGDCHGFECKAYRLGLLELFEHVLSCFYYNSPSFDATACKLVPCPAGLCNQCNGKMICDGDFSGGISVESFCTAPFPEPGEA